MRQIAGDKLKTESYSESIKDSVERDKQRQALQKKINTLQMKMRKEKQLNRKMEIHDELKKLKAQFESL